MGEMRWKGKKENAGGEQSQNTLCECMKMTSVGTRRRGW